MADQKLVLESLTGRSDEHRILRLNGPLTLTNIFEFQAAVRADAAPLLIIDLTEVPYIDSAGIGALIGASVTRKKDGRRLALVGANERVITVLKITNVESFFSLFPTVDQAEQG